MLKKDEAPADLVKKLGLEQYDWTALIRRKVPAKFLEANLKAYQVGLQSV